MLVYTFKVLSVDGKTYYPTQFKWEDPHCPPPVGMLDFYWTENIKSAKTWSNKDVAETIAMEFCDSEVITIEKDK